MSSTRVGGAAAGTVSTIAIIISVIALILAWVAYDRTGGDLDERIRSEVQTEVQQIEPAAEEAAQDTEEAFEEGVQDTEGAINEGAQEVEESTDDQSTQ